MAMNPVDPIGTPTGKSGRRGKKASVDGPVGGGRFLVANPDQMNRQLRGGLLIAWLPQDVLLYLRQTCGN